MSNFFNELKRRNVIKAAIAYMVAAWVLLQVVSLVLPIINAPDWVLKTFTFFLALAFPIWIIFSWVYEITPEGIKKTQNISKDTSTTKATDKRLNILILVGIIALIGITILKPSSGYISDSDNIEYAIAVLPFDDMSAKKDTEWFCDGVTEDILTHLSKIKGLKVISRTSTERYKNTTKSIPEIAAELGVAYLVEGSVRKQNDDVLITAQLINANDEHVWAEKYNEKMKDVFKVQGDVSKKIVKQLKISISPKEEKILNEFPTQNIKAYEAFAKGRTFRDKGGLVNAKIAREFFKEAIELDSRFADAYAELGYTYMGSKELKLSERIALMTENIDKALELNPNSSIANSYKGIMLVGSAKNKKEAFTYFEKAIKLNPSNANVHNNIAAYYSFRKKDSLSLFHSKKALTLDPFSLQSQNMYIVLLAKNGKYEEAKTFYAEKKEGFSNFRRKNITRILVDEEAKKAEKESQTEPIGIYEEAIKKYPENSAHFTYKLAGLFDGVYNDQKSYLQLSKKSYELDSSIVEHLSEYHQALVESGKFKEAQFLRASKNYQKLNLKDQILLNQFSQYYFQNNLQKAKVVIEDSLPKGRYLNQEALLYAKLKDSKKRYRVMSKITDAYKVLVYAILDQKDSLNYLLKNGDISLKSAQFPNSRAEMNPYRKTPEYIAYLKKNKFPVELQKK